MAAMSLFPPGEVVHQVSLVRLSTLIARSVAGVGLVQTEGEVVRPSTRPGRIWFTLRDRAAQITVTCASSRAGRCRTVHGERVRVTGRLTWLPDRGQLQLEAQEVVPVGEGAIQAHLEAIKERLAGDGLLSRPRRRLPMLPATIGVVCGADAAVRADIESVVAVRFPGYPLAFREVNLSGPGAADSIIQGLQDLDAHPEVEVIILARGGGDAVALLPFSDEDLCRAVAAAATPVVSAIGHDRDRPLCDEVADLRCGTPSLAAGAVVPDRAGLQQALDGLLAEAGQVLRARADACQQRLARVDREAALQAGITWSRHHLEQVEGRLEDLDPNRWLADAAWSLRRTAWGAPLLSRLSSSSAALASQARTVEALDPARVLGRGYAIVRGPGGVVLRDPGQVQGGDELDVALARGPLRASVLGGAP
jgi:exodeoxyribonuclease VII large subunit